MMQKGDIGTVIILDTGEDISTATLVKIRYKKPNGDTGEWTASVNSTEVRYTTLAGDIDQTGDWEMQAYVELAAWQGYSAIVEVPVGEQLKL